MTHTTKHTPGPWYAANMGNDFQGLVVEEQTGKNIAVAYDKRDVHILAAAPAMYEALQHATMSYHHPSCKAQGEYAAQPERYCTCHVQKARAALAQAEGKAL